MIQQTVISKKIIASLREVLSWARGNEHTSLYTHLPDADALKSVEDLKKFPSMSIETLRQNAEHLRHYEEKAVRFLSSEFDSENLESLFLIPQKVDESWDTLEKELLALTPRAAFLSIPPFWQISPFFYHTCRANHVPVSVGNPRSPNLSLQIIEGVAMEYAMVTPAVMHELRAGLLEKKIRDSVKLWHVVSPLERTPDLPRVDDGVETSIEYHVFPGVPVAYTSPEQYEREKEWSAPLPEYYYEFEHGKCFITSLQKHAMPLVRLELPASVECDTKGATPRLRFV